MKLSFVFGIRGARDKPRDSHNSLAYSFLFGRNPGYAEPVKGCEQAPEALVKGDISQGWYDSL